MPHNALTSLQFARHITDIRTLRPALRTCRHDGYSGATESVRTDRLALGGEVARRVVVRRAGCRAELGGNRPRRHLQRAPFLRLPAAGAEAAARGWVRRGGHLAGQDDALAALLRLRVRHR